MYLFPFHVWVHVKARSNVSGLYHKRDDTNSIMLYLLYTL